MWTLDKPFDYGLGSSLAPEYVAPTPQRQSYVAPAPAQQQYVPPVVTTTDNVTFTLNADQQIMVNVGMGNYAVTMQLDVQTCQVLVKT